jgi:hypothetical protein
MLLQRHHLRAQFPSVTFQQWKSSKWIASFRMANRGPFDVSRLKSLNHDVTHGASNAFWARDGDGHTEVERRMAPKSRRPQSRVGSAARTSSNGNDVRRASFITWGRQEFPRGWGRAVLLSSRARTSGGQRQNCVEQKF